jgi:hypothetical protein
MSKALSYRDLISTVSALELPDDATHEASVLQLAYMNMWQYIPDSYRSWLDRPGSDFIHCCILPLLGVLKGHDTLDLSKKFDVVFWLVFELLCFASYAYAYAPLFSSDEGNPQGKEFSIPSTFRVISYCRQHGTIVCGQITTPNATIAEVHTDFTRLVFNLKAAAEHRIRKTGAKYTTVLGVHFTSR